MLRKACRGELALSITPPPPAVKNPVHPIGGPIREGTGTLFAPQSIARREGEECLGRPPTPLVVLKPGKRTALRPLDEAFFSFSSASRIHDAQKRANARAAVQVIPLAGPSHRLRPSATHPFREKGSALQPTAPDRIRSVIRPAAPARYIRSNTPGRTVPAVSDASIHFIWGLPRGS